VSGASPSDIAGSSPQHAHPLFSIKNLHPPRARLAHPQYPYTGRVTGEITHLECRQCSGDHLRVLRMVGMLLRLRRTGRSLLGRLGWGYRRCSVRHLRSSQSSFKQRNRQNTTKPCHKPKTASHPRRNKIDSQTARSGLFKANARTSLRLPAVGHRENCEWRRFVVVGCVSPVHFRRLLCLRFALYSFRMYSKMQGNVFSIKCTSCQCPRAKANHFLAVETRLYTST